MEESKMQNIERELLARTEKLNELMKGKQILIRKFQEILNKLGYEDYYMLEDAERDFKEIIRR